jgi:hypothetical protein
MLARVRGSRFTAGSTRDPRYDGAAFAARGVVLVTLQYRIGPFGWLDLSSLGPEYTTSGDTTSGDNRLQRGGPESPDYPSTPRPVAREHAFPSAHRHRSRPPAAEADVQDR